MLVSGGVVAAVSTVQVYVAGVGSVLPAGSVARTWKVWLPELSAMYVFGLVHEAKGEPSRVHSNVLPASVEVNVNSPTWLLDSAGGFVVIVVSGAVVSMVQVKLAGVGSTLPAGSIARTWKVWLPAASAL